VDLTVDLLLDAYNQMGYDALTPGEVELAFGVQYLLEKKQRARFPFLLANLIDQQSKKPVFLPYLIKELGGYKIGVLGLISSNLPLPGAFEEKGKYFVAEPIKTTQEIAATLRNEKCQALIVLAHMEEEEQVKLAQAVPEIQFIISGHNPNVFYEAVQVKNTRIFGSGTRGEYMGQLDLALEQEKWLARYRLAALTEDYPDSNQMEELLRAYKAKYQNRFFAAQDDGKKKETPREQSKPWAFSIPSYLGDAVCRSCHSPQYENWQKTRHARAFQTLMEQRKSTDFSCLPCHTTGLQERNDPGNLLENVQCESCHGPGKGHPESKGIFSKVGEAACLPCHNPAKSPSYNHESYFSKIRCPK